MKMSHCLVSMAALFAAILAGSSAHAASNCLQLQLSAPAPICAGQLATISASVTNSCPTRERVNAQLTLDEQQLPLKASFSVAGDSTLSKGMSLTMPPTATPGSHTLTVTVTDAAGDEASATIDLSVSSCSVK